MNQTTDKFESWEIPEDEAEYCRAVWAGEYRSVRLMELPSGEVTLAATMPPISEQSVSATCTAHAVAALVAFAENPASPPRLSAQFLFDMVKRMENVWISKNIESIKYGFDPDSEFRLAYRRQYDQLKMLLLANGGPKSAASETFIANFEDQLRNCCGVAKGSMVHRCFEVVRDYGICREELRPSASVQRLSFAGQSGSADIPHSLLADALRHRVAKGLRVFEHPNNVNEIRNMLSGTRKLKPMPVCVGVDIFEGCTDGVFTFPRITADGKSINRPLGLHEVLVVGYEDDAAEPGGGRFTFRNSWGDQWGENGYGTMSYAYLEVFCHEAGTILSYANEVAKKASSRPHARMSSGGGMCGACGKTYLSGSSLRWVCEEAGCEERICFDCWTRLGVRKCNKHLATK